MSKLRIKKAKEKNLIGTKFRHYIDFVILICCSVIAFNIHPSNIVNNENSTTSKSTMTYIFHDYEGNEYVMNDHIHGSPGYRDYLFDDEVPDDLKGDEKEFTDSVSLGELINSQEGESSNEGTSNQDNSGLIKDNQVSINEIISELGVDYNDTEDSGTLVISIGDTENTSNENLYSVREDKISRDNSSLIIEKINGNIDGESNDETNNYIENNDSNSDIGWNNSSESNSFEDDGLPIIKSFSSIEKDRVLPVLIPRNDLFFYRNDTRVTYEGNSLNGQDSSSSGITIIDTYASCMTPWGYKIAHGDSVLAYKQVDNAPDVCNIERRFCWKGKLSGTYTQQGCSVNKNYTYEQRDSFGSTSTNNASNRSNGGSNGGYRQNSDKSVTTVKNSEIGGSFVFDRPNNIYSDYDKNNNIKTEDSGIEQTSRSYPDCTAPRGEKVKHGQFIQAFKHANGFYDAPCEAQIRLCSMGELMGTYTESTCKTRDTSFIDWVNGSPSRNTYSKEKLEWAKKQIKNEQDYYENARKNAGRSTNSDALDRILYVLDQDN